MSMLARGVFHHHREIWILYSEGGDNYLQSTLKGPWAKVIQSLLSNNLNDPISRWVVEPGFSYG